MLLAILPWLWSWTGASSTPTKSGLVGGTPSRKSKSSPSTTQGRRLAETLAKRPIEIRSSSPMGGSRVSLEDFQSKLDVAKARLVAAQAAESNKSAERDDEEVLMHLLTHLL